MNLVPVNDKHCVVLMSGGIDSSATLATLPRARYIPERDVR